MKKLLCFLLSLFLVLYSCKKDEDSKKDYAILTQEDISDITSSATTLSSEIQTIMFSFMSDPCIEHGYQINYPEMSGEKSTGKKSTSGNGDWTGPDADGWYTMFASYEGLYDITEKVRCRDTIIDYEYSTSYSGGDGSYSNVTKTEYVKYKKNGKTLYKGYWDWTIDNSGYNDISSVHWKMTFEDWDPETSAGVYDWWWGATSNGNTDDVPFYRYLNVTATEAQDEWLNVKVTMYDQSTEIWSYEYESPWSPVEMPDFHTCGN